MDRIDVFTDGFVRLDQAMADDLSVVNARYLGDADAIAAAAQAVAQQAG